MLELPLGEECAARVASDLIRFDEIGYWSEVKLDIVRKYAIAYSTIMSARIKPAFEHAYIDAFAGCGVHVLKRTGEFVLGSPLNALLVKPPFRRYYLIDIRPERAGFLREMIGADERVEIFEGDCNEVLAKQVFPAIRWDQYHRGLCLLDPYGLHLDWQVLEAAGRSKAIDVFLNFPVADINRNVLWRNPEGVGVEDIERMNRFWGDESWRDVAYSTRGDLFGHPVKTDNETIASAFRDRLIRHGYFQHVPEPMPMRNSKGAVVYYLFFASQKPVAANIVEEIFDSYRQRGDTHVR